MPGGGSEPGERRGGRQKGTPNKATAEVRGLALQHGPEAIKELARLSKEAASETARISAIGILIDRAYGKALPGRTLRIDLPDTSTVEGVTKAVAAIMQAAARGEVTPAEASDLCGVLETQRRTIELSEIEARLARLEARGSNAR
jgi:hypothetical protein